MLEEEEKFFKQNGIPLFSSHMIDLVCFLALPSSRVPMLTIPVWYVAQQTYPSRGHSCFPHAVIVRTQLTQRF